MFTGIVENVATLVEARAEGSNIHFTFKCDFISELYIDQSLAHNGVCLTVVEIGTDSYVVTAIQETLSKTNLGKLKIGDLVNLERSLKVGDRLDGHMVQGHVDGVGVCTKVINNEGSWDFHFEHPKKDEFITVTKGSICINGVSLTIVNSTETEFSVSIIPYTFEHTNFKNLNQGDLVNLEFDILGKYFAKKFGAYQR